MVWIIAFLCLGLVGAAGYYQGPIRAAFAFFGLLFGSLLAGPLSPLTERLLPLIGLHHPVWSAFAPKILAFLIVLAIFKIAGQVVHQKVAVYFKYKVSDQTLYRWQRVYARLGLAVGLLNGSVYFILLTLLIYCGGYFAAEAGPGEGEPASVRFLSATRTDLHDANLDQVLASYDFIPKPAYQTSDLIMLVLRNPPLLSRLALYPPCLQLAARPEFKDLTHDAQLQQMINSQAKVAEILRYPKLHDMLTNAVIIGQLTTLFGHDLDDLQTYLATGQSPKYDPETVLGKWNINRAATFAQLRKKQPNISPKDFAQAEQDELPIIEGLSLTVTPDSQIILKKPDPNNAESTIVAAGTWKKDQDTYQVNLPGSVPETSEIEIQGGNRLFLPKSNYVLVFDKEL